MMDTFATEAPSSPASKEEEAVRTLAKLVASEDAFTGWVLQTVAGTPDPRLRQIVEAFVRHSHAFLREVRPTPEEYETALRFLVDLGHNTTATKNEVVIFADTHGLSTMVDVMNHAGDAGGTASALLGPFYRANAPWKAAGDTIAGSSTPGPVLHVSGQVRSSDGTPLRDAVLDIWQSSPVGLYENQDENQPDMNLRGRFRTDGDGHYQFRTVRPAGYPVPTDGPIGTLLKAEGRHPFRPAHLHFLISEPLHRTLITQVFVGDDERLTSDVAFGTNPTLIGAFVAHETADAAHPERTPPFFTLDYDFVMQPGTPSFPVPPIP